MNAPAGSPRTLAISGGLAAAGDEVVHAQYGVVTLQHSDERDWHYLRMGHAGFGNDFENLRVGKDPDQIVLSGPLAIANKDGLQIHVKQIAIDKTSYIPDVWVFLDWEKSIRENKGLDKDTRRNMTLWDDDVFLSGVLKRLRDIGYEGPDFGRAELGAQGNDVVCMEPEHQFCDFVMTKGWVYAGGQEEYKCSAVLREIDPWSQLSFTGSDGTEFSLGLRQLLELHALKHQKDHGGERDQILLNVTIPLFKENTQQAIEWVGADENWGKISSWVKVNSQSMPNPQAALQSDEGAQIHWGKAPKKSARP
jgi:hypothetical protein